MSKTQPALRIMGDRVRYFRKLKGLSQAELAKDICTQATISLIEKRNKVPSMNILIRLTNRLGIGLDDIVVENQDRTQKALAQVGKQVRHGDYVAAAPGLTKVNVAKLTSEGDQKRYYYYRGMVELFVNHAQDEAIYYFGRVLNQQGQTHQDLAAIMATLGLGIAYAEKGTTDRASVYLQQADQLLKQMPLNEGRYLEVELTIYWHSARIYFELKAYDEVLKYLQLGIDLAVKNDSLFLLAELYTLQARTYKQLGDAQASRAYQIALALAQVTASGELVTQLQAEAASA